MKKITGLVLWLCPAVSLPFLVAFSEKTAINPAFILLFSLLIVYFLCFSIFYPLSKEPLGAGAVYGGILICAGYGLILGQNNDEFRLAGLLYSSMFGSVIGIFSGCFLADKLADPCFIINNNNVIHACPFPRFNRLLSPAAYPYMFYMQILIYPFRAMFVPEPAVFPAHIRGVNNTRVGVVYRYIPGIKLTR